MLTPCADPCADVPSKVLRVAPEFQQFSRNTGAFIWNGVGQGRGSHASGLSKYGDFQADEGGPSLSLFHPLHTETPSTQTGHSQADYKLQLAAAVGLPENVEAVGLFADAAPEMLLEDEEDQDEQQEVGPGDLQLADALALHAQAQGPVVLGDHFIAPIFYNDWLPQAALVGQPGMFLDYPGYPQMNRTQKFRIRRKFNALHPA